MNDLTILVLFGEARPSRECLEKWRLSADKEDMDGNVLERICDPGKYSLEDAQKLGAVLFKLDTAVPFEIADLIDSKQETWPLATIRRARAVLHSFRRSA